MGDDWLLESLSDWEVEGLSDWVGDFQSLNHQVTQSRNCGRDDGGEGFYF
jgi:hypothetical protein